MLALEIMALRLQLATEDWPPPFLVAASYLFKLAAIKILSVQNPQLFLDPTCYKMP